MSLRQVISVAVVTASTAQSAPPAVTLYQKQLLESAIGPAMNASQAAESELLTVFASTQFKNGLKTLGTAKAQELAASDPESILRELKENLAFVEYTTNFNLDIVLSDWSEYGWYLSSWQYCVLSGKGCPAELYDIAETTLYKLKPFAQQGRPSSMDEANERGRYVFKNIHLLDVGGDWNFGSTVLIYRQSVIRDRSIQVGGDSGLWVEKCVQHTSQPAAGYDCDWMNMPQGRLGADLHEFYGQAVAWHTSHDRSLEAEVAQNVWHLVDPNATANSILGDPEVIIMGSVTPDDVKTISASFGAMFGTTDADNLIAACEKYNIPLVWHFGDGSTQSKEPWNWTPDQPFHCGRPRLIDPATVAAMSSGGYVSDDKRGLWSGVQQKARAFRSSGAQPTDEQVTAWFSEALGAQTTVAPLRTGNTCDVDLCFGKRVVTGDCACRQEPSSTPTPTTSPPSPTPSPPTPPPSPTPNPPTPQPPTPRPSPSTSGKCCYGGCSGCNAPGTYCSQSQRNCEGSCGGQWCAATVTVIV